MRLVKCPCCGHVFDADASDVRAVTLSPVALAVLRYAPQRFRRGQAVSENLLAQITGYSRGHVRRGLFELFAAGYVTRIPYGKRGRAQFAGVPAMFAHLADSPLDVALAAAA